MARCPPAKDSTLEINAEASLTCDGSESGTTKADDMCVNKHELAFSQPVPGEGISLCPHVRGRNCLLSCSTTWVSPP